MRRSAAIATLIAGILSPPAFAGPNPEVHLALDCRPAAKRPCGAVYASCDDVQQVYAGEGPWHVIVVMYHYTGVRGIQFAVDYSAIPDVEAGPFHGCGKLTGTVYEPGRTHVWMAWSSCQIGSDPPTDAGIMVGWFELWGGPGRIDFVPHFEGFLQVVDCETVERDPIHTLHPGFVGGAMPGPSDLPPCFGPTAATAGTWGAVKALYY